MTVISCSSDRKCSCEGFKWEVMPSGGKLFSAFTQVLHLKGNCGILKTQALYSHVSVCKWITLSKTIWNQSGRYPQLAAAACLLWLQHSPVGTLRMFSNRSLQRNLFSCKRVRSFFGTRNSLTQGEVLLSNLTRAELLQDVDSERRWRNCHQDCIIKGSHSSCLSPASWINLLERFQNF